MDESIKTQCEMKKKQCDIYNVKLTLITNFLKGGNHTYVAYERI